MWTRMCVASCGLEKIRLLPRSSYVRRYLQIRESFLQPSLGCFLHRLQDAVESDARYQVVQQSSTESHFEQESRSCSSTGTFCRNQETFRLTEFPRNTESKLPSSSRSSYCSLRLRHFPQYHSVKGGGKLSAPGRHFGSLSYESYPCSEDEASPETPDATQDIEHGSSKDAGASETWHTKLSAIIAADPLSSTGTRTVAETTAPPQITTAVCEQDRRPSGVTSSELRSRPTPFSVCQRLRTEKDIEGAWNYFTWAGEQEGYKHNVDTYNSMIQCLCEAKRFSTASDLLETMRAQGFSLTHGTCVKIMKSLASEKMYDDALAFFRNAEVYGCKPNVMVYNSYLDILVKVGHYNLVEATFVTMPDTGVCPDVYTYNIVINGFRKADQVEKALRIYEEMKVKGCTPNVVTYNTVLHALGTAGRTEEVLELFCEMAEKDMAPSAFTYSTLLHIFRKDTDGNRRIKKPHSRFGRPNTEIPYCGANGYRSLVWTLCKEQDISSALRRLREMESQGHNISLATYNLFAVFLGDAGESDAVLDLFREMKAKNCVLDALSYRTAVEAACRAQNVEEALLLHNEMVGKGHAVATRTWNILIDVAWKAGQVDTAFELFSEMQKTCRPDIYTYNNLISILCNVGKSTDALTCSKKAGITSNAIATCEQAALELFRRMKEVTVPDSVTYRILIHALCRSGRVQECQDLLLEMEENGVPPGVLVYNKVLNVLGRAGKVDKAWKLFLKMQSNNLADVITYTTLIKFLAKAGSFGKATKLLGDMERKGLVPNIVTYTTLVDGLAKSKRFVEVDNLMEHMAEKGCYPDSYAYNSLVDAYCKAGLVSKAYRIFEESIDKGCLPNTYTYTSLINGYFRSGNTNDALDMFEVMKGMGCKPSGVTYNILLEGLGKAGRMDELVQILEEIGKVGVASTGVSTTCFEKAFSFTRQRVRR